MTKIITLALFVAAGISMFSLQQRAYAVSCDAIVGDWAWFTGGNVTLTPEGTITSKEFGNLGTWECTNTATGVFTLRWVFGNPPFVDTLTLSADGQSLSGKNQYQYPVTANRISTAKKADDVVLSQDNIGYVPSLNANVTSLRFFESGYNTPPREQRVYSNQFDKSMTRYVNWEIDLKHPAPGRRIDFVIEQLWYRPNGSLLSRQTFNTSLNPEWTSSYFHHSYGWRNPGNWSNGSYRVDLFIGGQKVTSGSFEIYSAGSADAYFSRGYDYLEKKMYDEAIAEFSKAIKINPKFSSAYNNRCDTYRIKKQYQEAISDCTKAIELKPDFADAYHNRGLAYDYSGQDDKAILDYTKAIELNPKEHKAYNNRGVIYSNRNLDDKAISDFTKAIEINPNYALAYSNRCVTYMDKKLYEKAISDCNRAIEINPKDAEVYYVRADFYHELKDYKKSLEDLNKAIELKPDYAKAYDLRADIHDHLDDLDSAIKDLKKAKELGYKIDEDYLEELEFFNQSDKRP